VSNLFRDMARLQIALNPQTMRDPCHLVLASGVARRNFQQAAVYKWGLEGSPQEDTARNVSTGLIRHVNRKPPLKRLFRGFWTFLDRDLII
jgi:hypothetical protein